MSMQVHGTITDETQAIMLSWIGFHGRSAGIAEALDIPAVYISGGTGNTLARYLRQWRATRKLLRTNPNVTKVVLMMPPFPALLSTTVLTHIEVAGDLHTGVFYDPKWKWALAATAGILKRRGIGIATNPELASDLTRRGVTSLVLHDQITNDYIDDALPYESSTLQQVTGEWILVPLAYAYDEPLDEILTAAHSTPETTWVLTGKAPESFKKRASPNVIFPGYISDPDYRRAVSRASAIAALTTDENTMQRAGYEAMSAGQALLTTSMKVLQEFFRDAAVYARPDSRSLADGVHKVLSNQQVQRDHMNQLRKVRREEQALSILTLRDWIHS